MQILDNIGREIGVGDIISYPGRMSSSIWNNFGVVKRINDNGSLRVIRNELPRWGGSRKYKPSEATIIRTGKCIKLNKIDLSYSTSETIVELLEIAGEVLKGQEPVATV